MNRRKLLSLIGATALTPVIPAQVFAAGGIWNPLPCGFSGGPVRRGIPYIVGERSPELHIPASMMPTPEWLQSRGNISVTITR